MFNCGNGITHSGTWHGTSLEIKVKLSPYSILVQKEKYMGNPNILLNIMQ